MGKKTWRAVEGGNTSHDSVIPFRHHQRLRGREQGARSLRLLAGDANEFDDRNFPSQVKRATRVTRGTRVTVNASPEPVTKGKTITVARRVARAN